MNLAYPTSWIRPIYTLAISLLLSAASTLPLAAQPLDNRILVLGDAFEEVMANQATLNVNLSFTDERDSKLAYQEHQQAKERLMTLLSQQKIPAQHIHFMQLLSRKGQNYQRGGPGERFTTYQRVMIQFDNLGPFEQTQQALTAAGFTDLAASFSVSNLREVETRLLDKALARAQEKATQLAKATGRSIKRIVRVSDTSENEGFYGYREGNRNLPSQGVVNYDNDTFRQMALVPQLFRYAAAVKVEYELSN